MVVGCGGDRDKTKRPIMGEVACQLSDKVVFTSDNPRSEDANEILREMEVGLNTAERRKYISVTDRKEAIKTAVGLSRPADILLVAGKGHEKYQEIKGVKYPFDDKAVLREIFETMNK
jgi:UDP-N-acetylmuramoyl-L-alanyl-D-glutamate--2,6-diaminopimelate ligase